MRKVRLKVICSSSKAVIQIWDESLELFHPKKKKSIIYLTSLLAVWLEGALALW